MSRGACTLAPMSRGGQAGAAGSDAPAGGQAGGRADAVRARREATARRIVDATESLLATRSFAEVTVEDVMASAGLTRTAFYRYFPDLEAVLLAGLVDIRTELSVAADRWLAAGADPDAGLAAAATGLAEVYRRHGRMLLAFAEAAVGGGRVQRAWRETVESFVQPVEGRITAVGGDVADAHETARALVWMNERYLLETYGRGPAVEPEVVGRVLAAIWHAAIWPGRR